jgi:hypothetical protein
MRRSTLWMCALLVTATFGCEQVKKQAATVGATVKDKIDLVRERFFHKKPPPRRAAVPSADTAITPPAAPPEAATPATPAPAKRVRERPAPVEPIQQISVTEPARNRDIPYVSQDTGTIFPGMAEREVYALWGAPVAKSHRGEFTFLYFPNGCEYTCGHLDVVTLQNGRVTDAVLRWQGHAYAGQSTSPTGGPPEGPPPGGDILRISPDTVPTLDTILAPDTMPPDTMQTQPTTP